MRRYLICILTVSVLMVPLGAVAQEANVGEVLEPDPAFADNLPPDEFSLATVLEIIEEGDNGFDDTSLPFQRLKLRIQSGAEQGQEIELSHGEVFSIQPSQLVEVGQQIILTKSYKIDGSSYYFIADKSRLTPLVVLLLGFVVLVTVVVGKRGLSAFLGLVISIGVLAMYIVPQILGGANPALVSMIGAIAIALVSIYLAHGLSRQTTIALLSTILTLCIAALLSLLFVSVMQLSGSGSEEAFMLQLGRTDPLDLRGLLLGGIIIGALCVLDDITTAQTAAVAELKRANPSLSLAELYHRGFAVGKEHILSLVNTLVLAYAGASLPIFLFFQLNTTTPWWVIVNGEFLAEEIIRTLVGSVALILAVPITTLLAAYAFAHNVPKKSGYVHAH